MCGIFGYLGKKNVVQTTLEGLKKLEYRGYDSAGIAGIKQGQLFSWKEVGKVAELDKEVLENPVDLEVAIAQTRWATHGGITKENAHPHLDQSKKMALVHNGIIENFEILKSSLINEGVTFLSQTDTEVIVHLIAKHYNGNLLEAVQKTIPQLVGSYSIALVHADHPDTIVAVAHECPLVIGIGNQEAFVSSDYHAFAFYTQEVVYLSNAEIAVVHSNKWEIVNTSSEKINKNAVKIEAQKDEISKQGYEHFTLKEIFEQPRTIRSAIVGRFVQEYGTAIFDELKINEKIFSEIERILILGCGTSLNAGYIGHYMIEEMVNIPVNVEISSEFRYKNPVVQSKTLVIAISQSGETADTIAAVRELKAKGAPILSICNVYGSTLSRESDGVIYLKAGPEIGVCSTKAFTSQLAVISLISLLLARMRHWNKQQGIHFLNALENIPNQLKEVLAMAPKIEEVAKKYAQYADFFFLGRNFMFPTALEGALKLKEISYINANGYPAGEMKHGPIALINPDCPTVALCANKHTYIKMISNLMEVKARNGKIIAIAEQNSKDLEKIADDILYVPSTLDSLAPFLTTVVTQLLAYYIAKARGTDIDQPRNLAKSVTVE